jgi:integrase
MTFKMARLQKTQSGRWKARKAIPQDLRQEYLALYGKGHEEIFHAPSTDSLSRAKTKLGEWLAEIENRIATLRAKQKGEAHDLTNREAHALAGDWYRWFVAQHEEDPGEAGKWALNSELMVSAILNATPYWDAHDPLVDQSQRGKEEAVREEVHPVLADEAKTAQFLASKGEVLTREAMTAFLDCVLEVFIAACDLLERRARGDYSPDALLQTFPVVEPKKAKTTSGLTAMQLLGAYITAAGLADGSVQSRRAVFNALEAHLGGRAVDSLSDDDAQRWVASLPTKERTPRTVMNNYVAALRAACSWAVKQRLMTSNPFANAWVKVPKNKPRLRETQAFTDDEVKLVLGSALAIKETQRPSMAARRWVLWICAYTGARAGEITQLRVQDVITQDGVDALRLTPEAGSIKTGKARTVPLHEHLIAQGFLDYVRSKGSTGPLFYRPAKQASGVATDVTKPKKSRAIQARTDLSVWVRSLGVVDPEVSPTHGWRHTFKQRADRYSISDRVSDAITGHAPPTEGRAYGQPTLRDMAEALQKFPRYEL